MRVFTDITGLIGNTPLLELANIEKRKISARRFMQSWSFLIPAEA